MLYGSYEVDVVTNISANNDFLYSASNVIGSIDNVSVKEVGQDWSLETGWSIGEDSSKLHKWTLVFQFIKQALCR